MKQAAVYAKLDDILQLGPIEKIENAWNSPVTLVCSLGKIRFAWTRVE